MIAASLENDVLPALVRARPALLPRCECPGAFIDIGVPADYQRRRVIGVPEPAKKKSAIALPMPTESPPRCSAQPAGTSIEAQRATARRRAVSRAFAAAADAVVRVIESGGRLLHRRQRRLGGGRAAPGRRIRQQARAATAPRSPAEALTVDSSILTAIGNDYGFDQVFARQLAGKARPGDVFLGITTSGNVAATSCARSDECKRIGVTERSCSPAATAALRASGRDYCDRRAGPGHQRPSRKSAHRAGAHARANASRRRFSKPQTSAKTETLDHELQHPGHGRRRLHRLGAGPRSSSTRGTTSRCSTASCTGRRP